MTRDAEIALARTAAPASISDRATIKILTKSGYEVARDGDNGFVCMVMRGFSAPTYTPAQFRNLVHDPTVHAPICFTPPAARTAMPYYELRTKLAMAGKTPDQIAQSLEAAYVRGENSRAGMRSRLHTCGPRTSISRVWNRCVAPAHDGVRTVLRERNGRWQCLRLAASAGERRC